MPLRRLALAGSLLVVLLAGALAGDAWARGAGRRGWRRPVSRGRLLEVRPQAVRPFPPAAPLSRGAAAARGLLGVVLATGLGLHLRRGGAVRPLATGAALFGAAGALGAAAVGAGQSVAHPYLWVTIGTQRGGFALPDLYLALALLLAAAAGVAARGAPADPAPDAPAR